MHQPNFLEEQTVVHTLKPARRPLRLPRRLLIALGGVLAVWTALVGVAGTQAALFALDGKDALERARDKAADLDITAARAELKIADERFGLAERRLGVVRSLAVLPWARAQLGAVQTTVRAGRSVLSAVERLTGVGDDVLRLSGILDGVTSGVDVGATFASLPAETKRAMLQRLASAAPDLERAAADVDIAVADMAALSQDGLSGPVVSVLTPFVDKLQDSRDALRVLSMGARLLPQFAGLGEQKTTMLVFLNNAELRPGGGFVGSYALVDMKDGDVRSMETYDVYNLDHPVENLVLTRPPVPITRYLGLNRWFFRDANWSPDFAVSAKSLLDRRQAEIALAAPAQRVGALAPVPVHNLIGLTPAFASDLLRIIGPVTVDGKTYTADNVYDLLQAEVEQNFVDQGIPFDERKRALLGLVDAVRARLFDLPLSAWPSIIAAFERNIEKKHVALYSEDTRVEDLLSADGWGGRLTPPAAGEDAFQFVDANLGGLKSDPVVDRAISYALRFNNSRQLVAKATVRYTHRGSFDWKTSRYRSYVRLYVPKGSKLVGTTGSLADDKTKNPSRSPGATDVVDDLGFTSFGTFISVEPGETRDLTFEYVLPDAVSKAVWDTGTYRLTAKKQLGAHPRALTLALAFGKKLATADPAESRENWGDGTYSLQTTLDGDRTFSVGF